MKGRLRKLVLFVLLGVYVNIAVAWFFALTFDLCDAQHLGGATKIGPNDYWVITRLEKLGVTYVRSDREEINFYEGYFDRDLPAEALAPRWARLRNELPPRDSSHFTSRRADAYGWPLRTLWCEFFIGHEYFQERTSLLYGGIDLLHPPTFRENGWALPLFPIFPAFIVNSIFYAAIIWIAWIMPGRIRRRIRLRRGVCVHCAYDLRGSSGGEVCPECGATTR